MSLFLLNGRPYSWQSCTFRLDNEPMGEGVMSLDWEQGLTKNLQRGSNRSGRPMAGKPAGQYELPPMTMKVEERTAMIIRTYLFAKAPLSGSDGYGNAVFTMTIQVLEEGSIAIPIVHLIEDCELIHEKVSYSDSGEANGVEFQIQAESIEINGMTMYSRSRDIVR